MTRFARVTPWLFLLLAIKAPAASNDALLQQAAAQSMASGLSTGADAGLSGFAGALPRSAGSQQLRATRPAESNDLTARNGPQDRQDRSEQPPLPPGPFERQVRELTGERLRNFGTDLFNGATRQALSTDLPAAEDYLLGPGDNFSLRIWGQLEADLDLTVDATGRVFIPRIGGVKVAGVAYQQLDALLRHEISRLYRNFDLAVSSGRLKTLAITVVGHVRKPGVYPVNSLGTVMTALTAAGGPDSEGTLRYIEVRHRGGQAQHVDLYRLLLTGDRMDDLRLQAGDVINVPHSGPRVAVAGGVVRPAIYELMPGVSLSEALSLASGPTRDADSRRLLLDRISPDHGRLGEELTPERLAATPVMDGDILRVPVAALRYDQSVSLRGNVSQPRQLAWRQGLRVSDVIDSPDMLRTPAFWRSLSQRSHERGSEARADEQVHALAQSNALGAGYGMRLGGQSGDEEGQSLPRRQGPQLTRDTLNELRQREDINWDYATIERLDQDTLGTQLLSFNLRRAVIDRQPGDDLLLQPGDIITLYSTQDIHVPVAKRPRYVKITGEVAEPGIYRVGEDETLADLISRVGGLTPQSYLYGMQLARESVRERQRLALNEYVKRQEKQIEQSSSALLSAALNPEDIQRAKSQIESQKLALEKLRQQQPEGRVVLGLSPSDSRLGDLPKVSLEDGDEVTVPATPTTVAVAGEVFSGGDFLQQGGGLGTYLALAGGSTDAGNLSEAFVLRADGSVLARKQCNYFFGLINTFGLARAMPGDTLFVPPKLDRTTLLRDLRDVAQVFGQFGIGAAAIRTLRN